MIAMVALLAIGGLVFVSLAVAFVIGGKTEF